MPAIRDKEIKSFAGAHLFAKRSMTFEYMFGETEVYIVFIKRRQIENNFREQNNSELKTQALDFNVRYFAVFYRIIIQTSLVERTEEYTDEIIRLEDYEPVAQVLSCNNIYKYHLVYICS